MKFERPSDPSCSNALKITKVCMNSRRFILFIIFTAVLGLTFSALKVANVKILLEPTNAIIQTQATNDTKAPSEDNPKHYKTLIVTAYFDLKKASKHPGAYKTWIPNFLSIDNPMVIYTDTVSSLAPFRDGKPTTFVNITVQELQVFDKMNSSFLDAQHKIDPEKKRHFPNLYVIWDSKTRLIHDAATKYNKYNSDYFIWVDIGSYRKNYSITNWPDPAQIDAAFKHGPNRTLLAAVYWPKKSIQSYNISKGPLDVDFIEGGFFGGSKQAIANMYNKFYSLRDYFAANNYFVGKDQTIMNALLLLNPSDFLVLDTTKASNECDKTKWYYFFQHFASPDETTTACEDSKKMVKIRLLDLE